jgi:hypothetical protein
MPTTSTTQITPERLLQFTFGFAPPLIIEVGIRHRVCCPDTTSALSPRWAGLASETRITSWVTRVLACLDERREFRERLPPADFVVGGR